MKNRFTAGSAVIAAGLLIALGPQFWFKVCSVMDDMKMKCFWASRAEIGVGAVIAALGVALIIFASAKTRLGLAIGVFLSGILALLVPHALIGGCAMHTMACRKIAYPALTAVSILLLIGTGLYIAYLVRAYSKKIPSL